METSKQCGYDRGEPKSGRHAFEKIVMKRGDLNYA